MSNAAAAISASSMAPSQRPLAWGLPASFLLHDVLLKLHFGVIELRRAWRFAGVLRLLEEMR